MSPEWTYKRWKITKHVFHAAKITTNLLLHGIEPKLRILLEFSLCRTQQLGNCSHTPAGWTSQKSDVHLKKKVFKSLVDLRSKLFYSHQKGSSGKIYLRLSHVSRFKKVVGTSQTSFSAAFPKPHLHMFICTANNMLTIQELHIPDRGA